MALTPHEAIKQSRPPVTDELTYLTIIESHLCPEILPDLQDILAEDPPLTQSIGWDLVQQLLPLPGAELCLHTIAQLGNPREVILKVTEALQLLDLDEAGQEAEENDNGPEKDPKTTTEESTAVKSPSATDKFCTLVSLLSILHPRIKTKYPSRFLSTTMIAILSAYRPSPEATLAVVSFLHKISGEKRPTIPRRESSSGMLLLPTKEKEEPKPTPDPEAQVEDPNEAAIQKKLLQSFVTHILEVYIGANELEWAARLAEHLEPEKVPAYKKSVQQIYKEEKTQQDRDMIVGRLVALARDLGLSGSAFLFEAIDHVHTPESDDDDDNLPNAPEDIPLSQKGSLYLFTSSIFSSILFSSHIDLPPLTIFPNHQALVKHFIGVNGIENIGSESSATIDALIAIGLWLESSNKFVSGALEDDDFLRHLQTLSLISANSPSPTLRATAHSLASSILHAHPTDRLRLTFITDTLEHCPYENLKACAVGWLKDEIITAHKREDDNVFFSTVALAATQPYLFPDLRPLATSATNSELWEEFQTSFPFYMAVLNFLFFINGEQFERVVPPKMTAVVDELYVQPLKTVQKRLAALLKDESADVTKKLGEEEKKRAELDVELLGERIENAFASD